MAVSSSRKALENTLVVEIGERVGASIAGSMLAQLGADVVYVERTPDKAKPLGSSSKQRYRAQLAAGKHSLVMDADPELLATLVSKADVVITSSDAGNYKDAASASKSRTVVCDVTAYGRTSENRQPDTDLQIQALSAILETTGLSGGVPLPLPFPAIEMMTGVYAAASILAALRVRQGSGQGQLIDMSLYDCAFAAMATFLPRVLTGDATPVRRLGNRHPMIAPWNVYRASDGWMLLCVGNDAQWQRFCEITGQPELADDPRFVKTANRVANIDAVDAVVQQWVGERTVASAVGTLSRIDIACGPVAPIDGYPREANLDHRAMFFTVKDPLSDRKMTIPQSPLRMSDTPGQVTGLLDGPNGGHAWCTQRAQRPAATPERRNEPSAPLNGIRILEVGHYTTVPLSTRMLASLGSEVIKIEPPEGEATRDWPPAQDGQGYFFTYMNSDKLSVMLDIRKPDDAARLKELVASADVLIENLKPGALARRGFGPADLAAINPRLVTCSVSGFGVYSLYAGRPAYDTVIQAMSGVMDAIRDGDTPVKTGISSADLLGAEFAVLSILAALAYRDCSGKGQDIDLSMQDISAWMTQTLWNGGAEQAEARYRILACADRHVLAEALTDDALYALLALPASDKRSAEAFMADMKTPGIAFAPALTVHEMAASRETLSRELWFNAKGDDGKTWPLLASPLRLQLTPPLVREPMPRLGRDNERVFARDLAKA